MNLCGMADSRERSTATSTGAIVPHTPTDVRARISELDACILDLEESLAAARCERENLQFRLDEYRYPVLTLPVEITSEIFLNFLPIYPLRPPLSGSSSPAVLGQICSKWRHVALSTPQLWRAIEIGLRLDFDRFVNTKLSILETWLARSKNCPLSLSLQTRSGYCDGAPQLRRLEDTMSAHSDRLQFLDIDGDGLRGPFPLLRELTVGSSVVHTAATVFCDAPSLTTVHFPRASTPSYFELPWSQLTTISVMECELSEVANILRLAVSLVDFRGSLWDDPLEEIPLEPPLIMMQLESLTLGDQPSNDPGFQKLLLDMLTAPALRHLTVSERELGPDHLSTITSLLSRSHCSLESLHIIHSSWHEANYRSVFPSIPALNVSTLDFNDSTDEDEEEW
ncbi:hypothetical protein C8J57DRAFT_555592 [Mycena rebaudengoi]|nr:hypothetical protein C8J57DRAFT_555592 [Mycena rebaudengoi]